MPATPAFFRALRLPVFLLAICMPALVGCDGEPVPAAVPAVNPRADWPATVRFGLIPTEGSSDVLERFHPLEELLRAELGVEVKLVSASNYQGVITAMANNQLDFAWFGAKSYVEAARRADAQALLVELSTDGSPGYHALFIVPKASPIRDLAGAKGARFAFTEPNSTSGCLIPTIVLLDKMKAAPEAFFSEVKYSGAHGTSILQTASGELDIAATNEKDLDKAISKGAIQPDAVRVIHSSDPVPGDPIACRRALPESLKQAVVRAMLKVKDRPDLKERFHNGGYIVADDKMYDIIRAAEDYAASKAKSK